MAILRGHFAMVLILDVPQEASVAELSSRLEEVRQELGLEAAMLSEIETLGRCT
jgi:predicted amino acid-binding ACT domain protein